MLPAEQLLGRTAPSDLDGATLPPSGAPNDFVALDTPTTSNLLQYWKFHVDWTTPANSSLTGPTSVTVASYTNSCAALARGHCIPQGATSQKLDSLADRLMFRLAYRNFGDHEALVVNHTVAVGSGSTLHSGVRWYELRPDASGNLTLFQQGTYAPDTNWRWMGSAAMDKSGDIALGYSVSSATFFPQVHYTGRLAGDALGTMTQGESVAINGAGSQTGGIARWGDYSSLSVDPVDDCTFWYTTEYLKTSGTFNWSTRITSFKLLNCGAPGPTVSAIAPTSGSTDGGTAVTISGTGFAAGATVTIGGSAATSVVVLSPTSLSATTPAHAAGAVDVIVTAGGQSGTCSSCFTYIPLPTVTAINPTSGPAAGGTRVAITGTGFDPTAGATTVHFGAGAATGVSCASTTSCTATSPAGNGTTHVTVTAGGLTSATTAADQFIYLAFPGDPIAFIDAPAPGATVSGTVSIQGWAIDRNSTSGTGVDSVTLYLDGGPGTGTLLGTAVYGDTRTDVGIYYGSSRFDNSGWHFAWNTASTSNGSHTLYAVVHSSVSGTSTTITRAVSVTAFPGDPIAFIDAPAPGATVSGTVSIQGWAIDRNGTSGTGVDSVTLYLDGGPGTGTLLGTAVYGHTRTDVGTYYGSSRFDNSGWYLSWNTASTSNGSHTLSAVLHSSVSGVSTTITRPVNVIAFPGDPIGNIDAPTPGATVSGTFVINGWAIDRSGTTGTGVDSVTLYLDGGPGIGTLLGTAVYGHTRTDVGTYYGSSRFDNSGWHFGWNTASTSNGSHTLYAVVHSSVSGTSTTITRAVSVAP